jgi:nucleotide-binding universal stress UspA family protein
MAAATGKRKDIPVSEPPPILCGVDDSPGAREGARVAARLSDGLDLPLQLVHVARVTAPGHLTAYSRRSSEDEQLREGARLLRDVAGELEIQAEHRLEVGEPADRLAQIAEDERAPMLVVGSRGHGGLKAAVLGSVSRGLAARASCPLIVVPPRPPDGSRGRWP